MPTLQNANIANQDDGLLVKLKKLEPRMRPRLDKVKDGLWVMDGSTCLTKSMKGVTAYGTILELLSKYGEDYFQGRTLIDASSGNYARAVSFIANYLDLKCTVVVSDRATRTTLEIIRYYGAELITGGNTTLECYKKAAEIVSHSPDRYVFLEQLENWGSPRAHRDITGEQIFGTVPNVSEIYMAMGTGGCICGVAEYARHLGSDVKIFGSTVQPGNRIVGTFSYEVDYETPFIKKVRASNWTEEVPITVANAQSGAHDFLRDYAVSPGISGGGVYYIYQQKRLLGPASGDVVIIVADDDTRWIDKLTPSN